MAETNEDLLKKKNRRLFKNKYGVIIVFYFLFWVLWLIMLWHKEWFIQICGTDFYNGWFPALWEDLIFFTLGFIALVATSKLMTQESFASRISSLANGKNISADVEIQLEREIQKLLSFNHVYNVKATFNELLQSDTIIRVLFEINCEVFNMVDDENIPAHIKTIVEACVHFGGDYGKVYLLNFATYKSSDNDKATPATTLEILETGPIDLATQYNKTYIHDEYLSIAGDGTGVADLKFELLMPICGDANNDQSWYIDTLNGYTATYNFSIVNKLHKNVTFVYIQQPNGEDRSKGMIKKTEEIKKNETLSVTGKHGITLCKQDKIKLYLESIN